MPGIEEALEFVALLPSTEARGAHERWERGWGAVEGRAVHPPRPRVCMYTEYISAI